MPTENIIPFEPTKLTPIYPYESFRGKLVPTEDELARRDGRDYEPASAAPRQSFALEHVRVTGPILRQACFFESSEQLRLYAKLLPWTVSKHFSRRS